MLGRCRLRRGVSLEVIVEEDDNAEVTFDPAPLMEEDDDEDDDEDSEHGTGGSAPGSPRGGDDGRGGGGGGKGGRGEEREEGRSSAEERRRKRERRRTIGGLSRIRSVSCEALTLLDTSDMDSCCSEWDDDEDLKASNTGNYVTLNRPISRRRIIENCQYQCDSEDSGIEYHSNEDDHVLEDHSSNEDHVEMGEEEEDHVMMKEEEEEDGIRTPSTQEAQSEEEDNQIDDQEEGRVDGEEDDEESATIAAQSDQEEVIKLEEEVDTDAQGEAEVDGQLSARAGKEFFEERGKDSPKQERPKSQFAYSPNEALENDKIVIVETTPSAPVRKIQQSGQESAEEEMRLKREAYTIRNKEVRLAELPKPHIVKSVKQLFENLNTPVQHFHTWRDLGRFRDIKSNPSSKILRFDRSDGNDSPFTRGHLSLTLPRLPSQGGHQNTPNKTPKTTSSSTGNKAAEEVEIPQRTAKKVPKNYQETPMSKILTQSIALKGAQQEKSDGQSAKSQEPLQQVKFDSGEKVVLRKPIVKGFNVKRALMENPRNFLHHNHTDTQHHNHHHHHHNHQEQRNSQRTIRQRSSGHIKKSHHHSELADRSDTESLASDISDDSGVSNDSLVSSGSSSHSSSSYRALDAYASDPSFKWIDPAVMAKIRSVGTTVIFFGPRQRPRQEGTLPRGGTKSISSGLQVGRGHHANRRGQNAPRQGQLTTQGGKRTTSSRQQEPTNTPVPAPRIVGVVRKQSAGSSSSGSVTSGSVTSASATTPSLHLTPSPTPTPTEPPSDDSRASSPASRCEDEAVSGKAGKWREDSDTVVYNFTRPQPPAVYF